MNDPDKDHMRRLMLSARAAYDKENYDKALKLLRKLEWLMRNHKKDTATIRSLMEKIEARCESCEKPLDDEAIDGFCTQCLDKMINEEGNE